MTAEGFLQDTTGFVAFGNNKGLFGYNRFTDGAFSVTARSEDEKGSGYGVQYFTDASKLNTSQALEFLEEEFPATDERDEIVTFIRESSRGIIKRYTKGNPDDDLSI